MCFFLLFGMIGFDSSTIIWPDEEDGEIIHLTRKTFAYTDLETGKVIEEYNGKKVVISGDTKKNDLVLEMAQDADVLLHEVILNSLLQQMEARLKEGGMTRNEKIIHDIQDYHTTPAEVAEIASKAKVKKLVLHHFAPPPDFRIVKNLYQKELSGYDGEIHFSNDGDVFVIE